MGKHTPGAKAPSLWRVERPKAKALGYLEARTQQQTEARTTATDRSKNKGNRQKQEQLQQTEARTRATDRSKNNCNR
jgi:hypothetical protein